MGHARFGAVSALVLAATVVACHEDEAVPAKPIHQPADPNGGMGGEGGNGGAGEGGEEPSAPTRGECSAMSWARNEGASTGGSLFAEERARGVAVDIMGNLYATGVYKGDVDLGGGPLVAGEDNHSMFVVKMTAAGEHLWSKGYGDTSDGLFYAATARGHGIAATADGGAVAVGSFAGTIDFGDGVHASADEASPEGGCLLSCQPDIIIVRYDPGGAVLWTRQFGSTGPDIATDVAVASDGTVFVTGAFNGSIDFGGAVLDEAGSGFSDGFVLALDPNGDHVASMRFGGEHDDAANGLAVATNGDVLVVGSFRDTADFDQQNATAAGDYDGFVMRLDHGLAVQWLDPIAASGRSSLLDVAMAPDETIAVTGGFMGDLTLAGHALFGQYDDVLVVGLSGGGEPVWAHAYGGVQNDGGAALTFAGDTLVVAGSVSADGVDFGGGLIRGGHSDDLFILELRLGDLDDEAAHLCSRRYKGTGIDGGSAAHGIAVDLLGGLFVGGTMTGTVELEDRTLTADDQLDILFMRFE